MNTGAFRSPSLSVPSCRSSLGLERPQNTQGFLCIRPNPVLPDIAKSQGLPMAQRFCYQSFVCSMLHSIYGLFSSTCYLFGITIRFTSLISCTAFPTLHSRILFQAYGAHCTNTYFHTFIRYYCYAMLYAMLYAIFLFLFTLLHIGLFYKSSTTLFVISIHKTYLDQYA